MKKLTLDKVVEYVLILAITMVLVLIGNCINTITDGNPDTFVSVWMEFLVCLSYLVSH